MHVHLTRVRFHVAHQQLQKRRFAAPVRSDEHDLGTRVYAEPQVLKSTSFFFLKSASFEPGSGIAKHASKTAMVGRSSSDAGNVNDTWYSRGLSNKPSASASGSTFDDFFRDLRFALLLKHAPRRRVAGQAVFRF